MMMRYMSPGPTQREPHSPVREEFQPVYPGQQSGPARMRTPSSPPAQGEEENHAYAQFNVDRFMSCETMPTDCHRFGNSGGNKRQGVSGGDGGYGGGYSTMPSALGSYPMADEHFEAEAEVLPVDYSSENVDQPSPSSQQVKEGSYGRQQTRSPIKQDSEANDNGCMQDFVPPRRGKQSVTFNPQVDVQYPPTANQMQYPPAPPHDKQYSSSQLERQFSPQSDDRQFSAPTHERQYPPPPPHDRQYPLPPNDRQYPPPPNMQFSSPPHDRQYPLPPRDSLYPSPPGRDAQYPSSGHDAQYPPSGRDAQYPPSGRDAQYPPSGRDAQYPPSGRDAQYPPSGRDAQYPPSGRDAQYSPPAGRNAQYPPAGRNAQYPPAGREAAYPPAGRDSAYPPAGRDSAYPPAGQDAQYPPQMPYPPPPNSTQYPRPSSPNAMKYPPSNVKHSSPANDVMYPPPSNTANYPPPPNAKCPPLADSAYPPPKIDKYPTQTDSMMYPPPKDEQYPSPADAMMYPPPNRKEPQPDNSIPVTPAASDKKKPPSASESKCSTPVNDAKCRSPSKETEGSNQDDSKSGQSQSEETPPRSDSKGPPTRTVARNLGPRLPSGQPSVAKAQKMYCPLTQYGESTDEPEEENAQMDEMPEMIPARAGSPGRRGRCSTPNAKPNWPSSQGSGGNHTKPPPSPPVSRTCSPGGKSSTPTPQDTTSRDVSTSRAASPNKDSKGDDQKHGSRPSTPLPEKPLMSSELPNDDMNNFPKPSDDCMMDAIYPNPSKIDSSAPKSLPPSPVPQTLTGGSPRPAGPVPAAQMMVPPMGNFELPPEPAQPQALSPGPVPASQMKMPPMGNFTADNSQNQPCSQNYYGNSPIPPMGGNVDPWSNCYAPPPPWGQQAGQHYHSPIHHRSGSPSSMRERGRGASPGPQLDEFGRAIMIPARERGRGLSPSGLTDEFGRELRTGSPGPGSCGPESTRMWGQSGKRRTPTPRGHSPPRRPSSPSPVRSGSPVLLQNYWHGGGYYEPSSNFPSYPTEYCKNGQTMNNRPGSPRGRKHAGSSGPCDNAYPTPRQAQSPSNFGGSSNGSDQQYYYGEGDGGCGDPWRGSAGSVCENDPLPSHWRKSPGPTIGHMSPKEWCGARSRSRSRGRFHQPNQDNWPIENKSKSCPYPVDDADHGDVAESPNKHAMNRSRSKSLTRADCKSAPSSPTSDEVSLFSAYPDPKCLKTVPPAANEQFPVSESLNRCQTPVDESVVYKSATNNREENHEDSVTKTKAECQEGTTRRSRWEKFHDKQTTHLQEEPYQEEQNAGGDAVVFPKIKSDEAAGNQKEQTDYSKTSEVSAVAIEEMDECPLVQYPPLKRPSPAQQETELKDKQVVQSSQELDCNQNLVQEEMDAGDMTKYGQQSSNEVDGSDSGPASLDAYSTFPRDGNTVKSEHPQVVGLKSETQPSQAPSEEEPTETDLETAKYNQNAYSRSQTNPKHQGSTKSPSPRNVSSPVNFYPSPQDVRGYPPGAAWPPDYPYHDATSRRPRMPPSSHHQYPQPPYPSTREEGQQYHRSHPPAYQNQPYPPQGWQRGASPPPDQRNWQRGSSPTSDQRNWQRGTSPVPDPRYWPRGASPTHDQRRWSRSGSPTQQRGWPQRSASPTQRGWPQRGGSPTPDQRGGWPPRGPSPSAEYHYGSQHHNQQMPQQPVKAKRGFPPTSGYGPHPPCPDEPYTNGGKPPRYHDHQHSGIPPQQMQPIAMDEETLQRQAAPHPNTGKPVYHQAATQPPEYWTGSAPEPIDNKSRHPDLQEVDHSNVGNQQAQTLTQHCGEKGPPQQAMSAPPQDPEPPVSPKRYNAAAPGSPKRYQDSLPPDSPLKHQETNKAESPKRYPPSSNLLEDKVEMQGRIPEEGQNAEKGSSNKFQTPEQQVFNDANQSQQTACTQSQQSTQPTYCQQQQPPMSSQQSHQQQIYQQQKRTQTPLPQGEQHMQQQQGAYQQHSLPPQQQSQLPPQQQQQQPAQQQLAVQQQQLTSMQQKPPSPTPQPPQQSYSQQRPQGFSEQYNCQNEKQAQAAQQYSQTHFTPPSVPSTPIKQHGDGPGAKNYPSTPPSPLNDSWRQAKGVDMGPKSPQSPREQESKQSEETVQQAVSPRQMPPQLPSASPRKTPPYSLSPRNSTPQPTSLSPRKIPSVPSTPRKPLSTIDETKQEQLTTLNLDVQERGDEPKHSEDQIQLQEIQENPSVPSTPKSHKSDSSRGNESNRGNETSRTNESVHTNESNHTLESNHEKEEVVLMNANQPQERDLRAEVNRRIYNWVNATNMRMEEAKEHDRESVVRPLYKETSAAPSPIKKPTRQVLEHVGSMGDGNTTNARSNPAPSSVSANVRGNESSGDRNSILKEMVRRTSSNMGKEAEDTKKLDKLTEALAEAERLMETCRAKDHAVKESLGLKTGESTKMGSSDYTKLMTRTTPTVSATSLTKQTGSTPTRQPSSQTSDMWRSSSGGSRGTDSTAAASSNRWTPRDILNAELERRTAGASSRGSSVDASKNVRGTQSSSELRDIISNLSSRAKARAAPTTTTQVADSRSSSSSQSSSNLHRQDSVLSMTSLSRSKLNNPIGGSLDVADARRRSSTQDVRRPEVRGDPKAGNMDDEKFASMRDKFLTFFNNYQRNPSSGGGGGSTRH